MPTKEQIRNLELLIHKRHFGHRTTKTHGLHDWKKVTLEEQQILFCPDCCERLHRIFGGHYLYVYSGRMEKFKRLTEAIQDLMAKGKSPEEISELLGVPKKRIFKITDRLAKGGLKNVKL